MAENDDYATLSNVTSNFRNDLECPICLDIVKNPFKLCARGHLMCVGCLKTLEACPSCQGKVVVENPVCIKNLLEHLPKHCQYTVNGCEEIIENGSSHEKFCGFQLTKCRLCSQDVFTKDLVSHNKTSHDTFLLFNEEVNGHVYFEGFTTEEKYSDSSLVHLFNHLFWLELNYCDKKKLLEITFEAIPFGTLENDYYVNVSFVNGNFRSINTLKAFKPEEFGQTGQVADIENSGINKICVPQEMLTHFIDEESLVLSELVFFKR